MPVTSVSFRHLGFVSPLCAVALIACSQKKLERALVPPPASQILGHDAPPSATLQEDTAVVGASQNFAAISQLRNEIRLAQNRHENATSPIVSVLGDVEIPLERLLKEEFLFGTDLQYTAATDSEEDFPEGYQTLALTHKMAKFSVVGSRLLVTTDESLDSQSTFPKPEILAEFEILAQSEGGNATVRAVNVAQTSMRLYGEDIDAARKPWVRSVRFDPNGSYLILEVSAYNQKGKIFHFTESFFPRQNLVAGATAIDADNQSDDFLALLERLGTFLNTVWTAPDANPNDLTNIVKTKYNTVVRYDISGRKTIDWYVTRNLPDTLLPDIKAGIEGWNRYFNEFRPDLAVMVFRGKLPEHVTIGDPRYNVVNFDAVPNAAAAYESQAADPILGIQSHSLIYLPFAWYNFGTDAWMKDAEDVRGQDNARLASLIAKKVTRCARPMVSGFLQNADELETADEAGRALLRSTLLHEVGHALGMDHNFKASLVGEVDTRTTDKWAYSSSVMDYNAPTIEDTQIFTDLNQDRSERDPTKGAKLAYDRQFIDIVYNGGKQILANPEDFPVLPYCNDADADNKEQGVDPLCVRYDFFATTLEALNVSRERVVSLDSYLSPRLGGFVTLKGHLETLEDALRKKLAKVASDDADGKKTEEAFSAATSDAIQSLVYFLEKSKISYRRALLINLDLIGEWKAIPETTSSGEAFTVDSFEAKKSGLSALAQHVKGLVNEDKTFNTSVYAAYEKKVKSALAAGAEAALISGPDGDAPDLRGPFKAAGRLVSESISRMETLAASSLTNEEAKKRVQDSSLKAQEDLEKATLEVVAKYQNSLARLLPSEGTALSEGKSQVRGVLSPQVAESLFNDALVLARRTHAKNESRESAITILKKIHSRKAAWDLEGAKATRAAKLQALKDSLSKEFQALDAKYKTTGYLSESEKKRFESLGKMIQTLEDLVNDKA